MRVGVRRGNRRTLEAPEVLCPHWAGRSVQNKTFRSLGLRRANEMECDDLAGASAIRREVSGCMTASILVITQIYAVTMAIEIIYSDIIRNQPSPAPIS
jgi:hypothetical protein